MQTHCVMRTTTLLSLCLSLLALGACAEAPAASPKDGDLESRLLAEEVGDSDVAADGFTRLVEVRGTIGFGESVDSAYGTSGYRGWLGYEYRPAGDTSEGLAWQAPLLRMIADADADAGVGVGVGVGKV